VSLSLLLFATGALEQPNKPVGLVVVAGVKHSSFDNNSFTLTGNTAIKFTLAKNFSNLPSETTLSG
jgi:hypothetical protein